MWFRIVSFFVALDCLVGFGSFHIFLSTVSTIIIHSHTHIPNECAVKLLQWKLRSAWACNKNFFIIIVIFYDFHGETWITSRREPLFSVFFCCLTPKRPLCLPLWNVTFVSVVLRWCRLIRHVKMFLNVYTKFKKA